MFPQRVSRYLGILKETMGKLLELSQANKELIACYALIQLQQTTIKELSEKIRHLEELLKHDAQILNFNNKE